MVVVANIRISYIVMSEVLINPFYQIYIKQAYVSLSRIEQFLVADDVPTNSVMRSKGTGSLQPLTTVCGLIVFLCHLKLLLQPFLCKIFDLNM